MRQQARVVLYNRLFAQSIVTRRHGMGRVFLLRGKGLNENVCFSFLQIFISIILEKRLRTVTRITKIIAKNLLRKCTIIWVITAFKTKFICVLFIDLSWSSGSLQKWMVSNAFLWKNPKNKVFCETKFGKISQYFAFGKNIFVETLYEICAPVTP